MTLRFHNTLTQRVEPFEPLTPGHVKVYVCGITTYDVPHAGHGRTYTTFDVLVRHLKARGFSVTHVRNVTDVDDKIVGRAAENGEPPLTLSKRMSDVADLDLASIGCLPPDHAPRVSTHMAEIIALIDTLIKKNHAYVSEVPNKKGGKDVYFHVRSLPTYGKLSRRNIDDLLSGARVEASEDKKDPLDFALWKGEPEGTFGWPSPWGNGRPGWHIECSAMCTKYLGDHFDIHGGGMDLMFPHHENEIAQSEAAHGPPLATTWLHGGFLNVDSEKMSKSLGNFVTIRDVLARNDAEALRYFYLGTHYRGPLGFDVEKSESGRVSFPSVDEAERRVDYLYITRQALVQLAAGADPEVGNVLQGQAKLVAETSIKVLNALDKDLNTPQAIAAIGELAKAANEIVMQAKKQKDPAVLQKIRQLAAAAVNALDGSCKPLGLMLASHETYMTRTRAQRLKIKGLDATDIDAKIVARGEARAAKDFARADSLRKELTELGIEVLDETSGASSWRVLL